MSYYFRDEFPEIRKEIPRYNERWTTEEEDLVAEKYRENTPVNEIAQLLGRPYESVITKASQLRKQGRIPPRQRKSTSKPIKSASFHLDEESALVLNALNGITMTDLHICAGLAEQLGLTLQETFKQAYLIGIENLLLRTNGCIPFGFMRAEDGVHLVPYPEEQGVLALVRELREDGESWRAITAKLGRQGFEEAALPPEPEPNPTLILVQTLLSLAPGMELEALCRALQSNGIKLDLTDIKVQVNELASHHREGGPKLVIACDDSQDQSRWVVYLPEQFSQR